MIDPKATLKESLADWTDLDVAGYLLGRHLGAIPADKGWYRAKGMFWAVNEVGEHLIQALDHLVEIGFLEKRDEPDYQYRWRAEENER